VTGQSFARRLKPVQTTATFARGCGNIDLDVKKTADHSAIGQRRRDASHAWAAIVAALPIL
jgi:acetylornithine deacetylase/succinyl-diaminopimelate desuccinylase-like protein